MNRGKVTLKGSKKGGWIITVEDDYSFRDDIALVDSELKQLQVLINKKCNRTSK